MPKLGINIDHVATLRQARREHDPDPIQAARICEEAGADSIVCHLREDRRHINEKDVRQLRGIVRSRLNLEMSLNPEIVVKALSLKPDHITLVPERRQEITTEGGLDVLSNFARIKKTVAQFQKKGIPTSLFIDPVKIQVLKAKDTGATMIELHTGPYTHARNRKAEHQELAQLREMTRLARSRGLIVNAGHGLNYHNTRAVARISGIEELNIGHSVMARALFVGMKQAVQEMIWIVKGNFRPL